MTRKIENELWAKTILSLYRHLKVMANAIDNLVKKIGINSAFNNVFDGTMCDSNKMIELTERKIKIINLKVITEEVLNSLSDRDVKILGLLYIDGFSNKKVQEVLGINERLFFRHKEIALARFANGLASLGYDANYLNKYLEGEAWIQNTYLQIVGATASKLVPSKKYNEKYKLLRSVLNDFDMPSTRAMLF